MKRKFKCLLAGVLASLCFVCVGAGVTAYAENASKSVQPIEESYLVGADFAIPERKVNLGGKEVTATATLIYPDGTATKDTAVMLSQPGLYQVKYSASNGGAYYADTVTFTVEDKAFGVASKNSTVNYETVVKEFPAVGTNAQFNKSGVMVRLEKGDTLTVAELIDVSSITKEDVLIGLSAIPDEIGKCDFERFELVFTDSLDSSVQLRISVNGYPNEGIIYPFSYVRAGGENQPRKGYEASKNLIHVENNWGAGVTHSFYGIYNSSVVESWGAGYNDVEKHQIIKLRYDAEEVAVYGTEKNFVIDMDDPTYFDDLWNGFPSGKAKLTISASSYTALTANFLISEIYGVDLTAETFYDEEKPTIIVNTDYETMPMAKVGAAYSVPTASAFDYYSGELDTEVNVYYNYNGAQPVSIDYKNGVFVPNKIGYYTVVYTATDYHGNTVEEVRWVKAGSPSAPTVSLASQEGSAEVGTLFELPQYTVSGGSGNSTVKITAEQGTQTVDCTDGYFRPETNGAWVITYEATDYVGQKGVATFTLNTYLGDKPLFLNEPALPKAFVSGSTYTMPTVYAHDYTSGALVMRKATATVYDAANPNGITVAGGQTFAPTVSNSGELVTVKFQTKGSVISYEIPTILKKESGRLAVANYFVGKGFTTTTDTEGVTITAAAADAQFTFANALLAQNMSVTLTTLADFSNYKGLKIMLTDADDPTVSIAAYIRNENGYSTFIVGDSAKKVTKGFALADSENVFAVGYRNGELYMDSASVKVEKTVDGKAFNGFVNDKVWLTVQFDEADVSMGAAFRVSEINEQPIIKTNRDRIAPFWQVYGTYGGSYSNGSTANIPRVYASDVLDPNITFTLTVTDPDGNAVRAVDGTLLDGADPTKDYQISLKQLGNYRVYYYMSDTEERETDFVYQIISCDQVAPKLSYSSEWKTTATVGENYLFPVIKWWDDYAGAELMITVFDTEGNAHRLQSTTNAIRFTVAGVYKIHLMVTDASGNVTSDSIFITVNEVEINEEENN